MKKQAFILTLTVAILFVFTACGGNDDASTYLGENDQNLPGQAEGLGQTEQSASEDELIVPEFIWERVGDVTFIRPAHWTSSLSQIEPHEGANMEFWDANFDINQPFFSVRKLPLDGATPTLDDLLAEMLAEGRIEVVNAEIAPIIYPVDVAVVFGININANDVQFAMYEYNLKFIYEDWLYIVTAYYQDIDNHQYLILSMMQSMMAGSGID